jgi:DNA-binding transcriptional MerR regulator
MNLGPIQPIGAGTPRGYAPQAPTPGKIPPKLYRIGEVVSYAGVGRQTIHNYTTMGLLHESSWSPGGHRLYDESVFHRLAVITEMKAANKSLRDIQEHFARLDGLEEDSSSQAGQVDISM